MSIRRIACVTFFVMIASVSLSPTTHAATWVGVNGNLEEDTNWDPQEVPNNAAEAFFDGTSTVNPTSGDLAPKWITFAGAVSYDIGGGTITIPSNGNIDTWTTTADQTFSNDTLTFNGGALLNTAGIQLTISPTIFNVGGSTTITAGGGNIIVTPAVNLDSTSGTLILNGAATTFLNGGLAGDAKPVSVRMGTTGKLVLGSSGSWGGAISLGNNANGDFGNIEISTADALGAPGDESAGYTDLGRSSSGAVVVNNTGSPIVIGEYIYVRGRIAENTPYIVNQAGNNTFTGTIDTDVVAGSGEFVTVQANSGTLAFTGSFRQSLASSTRTLNLTGTQTGNGLIGAPLVEAATDSKWNVATNSDATWTISVDQNYTGTTQINGGTLYLNANHTGGDAYTVGAAGTLKGTGSTASSVSVDGVLAPGASIGTFGVGSLMLAGTLEIEYDAGSIDLLEVEGAVDVSLGTIDFVGADNLDGTSAYVFLTYGDGGWNGAAFDAILNLPTDYTIAYDYNGSSFALVPVPEPGSMFLLGIGVIGLAANARRFRK